MITLDDVLFRTNKALLEPSGMRNLQKLADFLNQYPQYKVLIEGYTDSIGNISVNQELSDRRAYTVRKALNDMRISGDRIRMHGYANTFPVSANSTAASRQLNRRVEILISEENGNIVPH